jgi:uncharacterized protein
VWGPPIENSPEKRLLSWFDGVSACAVALSGGVDSAVVASAAQRTLGHAAVAVTAVSPSLAAEERQRARDTAQQIGIRHRELTTDEHLNSAYRQNGPDRCFHCKSTLYQTARDQLGETLLLVNGTNLDDRGDYRPGMKAATDFGVRSPLLECEINKKQVREIAQLWHLEVWDKPASPCLSSRIAYGVEVTPARLAMIEKSERLLREIGFGPHRVRLHAGELARLEIQADDFQRLQDPALRTQLERQLKEIGFRFVAVELSAFRSGSLNQLIELEVGKTDGDRGRPS